MHVFCERLWICVCASFDFGFEGGVWDLIVLIPDHCLSILCKSYRSKSVLTVPNRRFYCVPSCLMFVCWLFWFFFPLRMFLFVGTFGLLSHDLFRKGLLTRFIISHLFNGVTSCCDFFPFEYCGRSLRYVCIKS